MGKLYNNLQKQLETEYKKEAEDCIKIYNKLEEISGGSVWNSDWNALIHIIFIGTYLNFKPIWNNRVRITIVLKLSSITKRNTGINQEESKKGSYYRIQTRIPEAKRSHGFYHEEAQSQQSTI